MALPFTQNEDLFAELGDWEGIAILRCLRDGLGILQQGDWSLWDKVSMGWV